VVGVDGDVLVQGHPLNGTSIVSRMQLELGEEVSIVVVEVHGNSLHP